MNARRVLAVAALSAVLPALVQAQELPPAKDLIQKWATSVNANGWKGHKSARTTASFDLPAMGMSAKMESAQMFSPSMQVTKIDLPGMGEMRQGFDGTTSWSMNPMQGPSVMPKEMVTAQKEDADPDNYSRMSPAIVSSETVEKTKLNDQDCFKVKHTWKSGRISHDCFSAADGMIVWSQTKTATPMGEMEVVTTYGAYKDFGGVKRATTTTVEQGGQQFIITLQGWTWDVVDPKEFELPPEIKALVDKKP
jgi:hypothetical protein